MSHLQWRKLDILDRIGRGELIAERRARKLVGLSRRQLQRLRLEGSGQRGSKSVVHENTGSRLPLTRRLS